MKFLFTAGYKIDEKPLLLLLLLLQERDGTIVTDSNAGPILLRESINAKKGDMLKIEEKKKLERERYHGRYTVAGFRF